MSTCIKLTDLLLPVRIDRVLNPAVSIILEATAMFGVVCLLERFREHNRREPLVMGVAILAMNTLWRLIYMLYLLWLVPQWIRDISVISSSSMLTRFLLTENMATCAVVGIISIVSPLQYINTTQLRKSTSIVTAAVLIVVGIAIQILT